MMKPVYWARSSTVNALHSIQAHHATITSTIPKANPKRASTSLPALIDRAVAALANARTAAEVLDARVLASIAYDAAKKAARLGQAKQAHDDLIAAAYRAQADALAIESEAKRRLADEYDAAQERGEVRTAGRPNSCETKELPGVADLGLSDDEIHQSRLIRDAEQADPGVVRRTLEEALAAGSEPTKAKVRRAAKAAAKKKKKKKAKRRPRYSSAPSSKPEPRHDSDLRRLEVAWESACQSARAAFLRGLGYSVREAA